MKAQCRVLSLVVAVVTLTPALTTIPAGAAAKQHVSITLKKSSVHTGQTAHITGRVTPAAPGTPIRLQRFYRNAWHGYKQKNLTTKSGYDFGVKFSVAGVYQFRVASSRAVSKTAKLSVVGPPRPPISPA
jgi:hypothetical protein